MITCKDCEHFNTREPEYLEGWCSLTLPAWVYRLSGASSINYNADVLADDYCDLGEAKK